MGVLAVLAVAGAIAWYEMPRLVRLRLWGELAGAAALLGIGVVLSLVQLGGGNFAFVTHWLYDRLSPVTRLLLSPLP